MKIRFAVFLTVQGFSLLGYYFVVVILTLVTINLGSFYLDKFGWLVGFWFNSPLRQYFSLYRAVSQREGERGKKG